MVQLRPPVHNWKNQFTEGGACRGQHWVLQSTTKSRDHDDRGPGLWTSLPRQGVVGAVGVASGVTAAAGLGSLVCISSRSNLAMSSFGAIFSPLSS